MQCLLLVTEMTFQFRGGGGQVILRVRPLNKKEEAEEADRVVRSVTSTSVSLSDQQFTFDAVAGEVSSQVNFYFSTMHAFTRALFLLDFFGTQSC